MTRGSKISLFFGFLIVNQILHGYEIISFAHRSSNNPFANHLQLFLLLNGFLFLFLLYLGWQILHQRPRFYPLARLVAVLFCLYGGWLAFGNIYRSSTVVGSFTGFIHVMITLPLILQISDYLKERQNAGKKPRSLRTKGS